MSKSTEKKLQRAVAVFDCVADAPSELSFVKGAVIVDIAPAPEEGDGWFFGRLEQTSAAGLFPGNYVKFVAVIEDEDDEDEEEDGTTTRSPAVFGVSSASAPASSPAPNHSPMAAYTAAFKGRVSEAKDKLSDAKEKLVDVAKEKSLSVADRIAALKVANTSAPVSNSTPAALVVQASPLVPALPKRTPPPPPPSLQQTSLSSRLAAIPGLGPSSDPQKQKKQPPPPPPQRTTASAGRKDSLHISPEHQKLYEAAYLEFARLFNPYISDDNLESVGISARQVRTVWLRSRVDTKTLGLIWKTVCEGRENVVSLNKAEFCRGLSLIDSFLAGKQLSISV
ncbi:hypothetical protein HDU83_004222 [Entophlyctis luteolus]|nr:hypothetical protein HDU83_004222 [Entophlyctis luteolus]